MHRDWEQRIDAFWAGAGEAEPEALVDAMRVLVAERPADDARGLYEWASVHDFVGREREAIPLYRSALRAGLGEDHAAQATVQLASSLRNVGDPDAAIEILRAMPPSADLPQYGPAVARYAGALPHGG